MDKSTVERIRQYREEAAATREAAERALTKENRDGYLRLADSWTALAEEIEAGTFGSPRLAKDGAAPSNVGTTLIRELSGMTHGDFIPLIEDLGAMVWLGDNAGQCVYLNKALRQFWGVEMADIPRFTWASTLLPEDQDALFNTVADAMRAQARFTVRARYRRADGIVRVLETNAEPRRAPNGEFLGMIGINTDVTGEN